MKRKRPPQRRPKGKGLSTTIAGSSKLKIKDGDVYVNGHHVGRLEQALKKGYHPAVHLLIGGPNHIIPELNRWWELDDTDIVDKAVKAIEDHIVAFDNN